MQAGADVKVPALPDEPSTQACRKSWLKRWQKRLTLIAHEEAVSDVQAGKRGVPVTLGCGGGL